MSNIVCVCVCVCVCGVIEDDFFYFTGMDFVSDQDGLKKLSAYVMSSGLWLVVCMADAGCLISGCLLCFTV